MSSRLRTRDYTKTGDDAGSASRKDFRPGRAAGRPPSPGPGAPTGRGPKSGGPWRNFRGTHLAVSTAQTHAGGFRLSKGNRGWCKWLPDAMPDCSHLSSRRAGTARPAAANWALPVKRRFGDGRRPEPRPKAGPVRGQRRGQPSGAGAGGWADSSDMARVTPDLSHFKGCCSPAQRLRPSGDGRANLPGAPRPPALPPVRGYQWRVTEARKRPAPAALSQTRRLVAAESRKEYQRRVSIFTSSEKPSGGTNRGCPPGVRQGTL
jgi:hypothetical protein